MEETPWRGGYLDDAAVVLDGGVDEDGVGVELCEHLLGIGEEEGGSEVEALGILVGEGGVGLDDGDELGVGVVGEGVQKAGDVAVYKADDGDTDGRGLGSERRGGEREA